MNNRNTKQLNRRGNVSLELVTFLPFLSIFLMLVFTITSISLSHLHTEKDAKYEAWKYRHTPWLAPELSELNGDVSSSELKIVQDGLRASSNAAAIHESKGKNPRFVDSLAYEAPKGEQLVLGGSWDHREIEFAKRSSEHRRLEMMDKVNFFGPNVRLTEFKRLISFGF